MAETLNCDRFRVVQYGARSYRGWTISFDYPPIPVRDFDYSAVHPDFDGPEDGRCVRARDLPGICDAVDEWIAENAEMEGNS